MHKLLHSLICALLAAAGSAHAQLPYGHDAAQLPTTVSLVTFFPGSDIYELEGHMAIRITTPFSDKAVSYGMFDFNSPNFVYRFVKGETDYMVEIIDWHEFMEAYRRQGRRIEEQVLDMTHAETVELLELLRENLRPENRSYRYNYVLDNCATRPLRIIEKAVGDSVVLGEPRPDIQSLATWRQIMAYYHRNYPWYQFGIDLALGSGIDRPLSNREKAFAPVVMNQQLPTAQIHGHDLVKATNVVYSAPPQAGIEPPTPFWLSPLFAMWLMFFIVAAVTVSDLRRGRVSRWLDAVLFGAYGLMGCLVAFLVFVSEHEATSPNFLLAWLNPFCFIAAVGVFIKKAQKLVMWYQILNFAVLSGLCLAWHWLPQTMNPAFIPMIAADMLRAASFVIITEKAKKQSFVNKATKKQ